MLAGTLDGSQDCLELLTTFASWFVPRSSTCASFQSIGVSQMILDGKLAGTLDAGAGCLEVFDEAPGDAVYPAALETLSHLGAAIDTLAARSQKVMA